MALVIGQAICIPPEQWLDDDELQRVLSEARGEATLRAPATAFPIEHHAIVVHEGDVGEEGSDGLGLPVGLGCFAC